MDDYHFDRGYFMISRNIFESDIWFKPPEYLKLWLFIIGKANHKAKRYGGFSLDRGQCFCTYKELTEQIEYNIGYRKKKVNESTVKRIMKYLRETHRVTTVKKPRGILITVFNYDKYQNSNNYEKTNERTTEKTKRELPANRNAPSINKNGKNEKNTITELQGDKLISEILKEFEKQGVDFPEAYLNKIRTVCTPASILKAGREWQRGNGITSPGQFFTRCKYHTANSTNLNNVE